MLTLARQRGEIDCGGLRYVLVGYGHFQQLVIPLVAGHLSIAFDLDAEPARQLPALLEILTRHAFLAPPEDVRAERGQ